MDRVIRSGSEHVVTRKELARQIRDIQENSGMSSTKLAVTAGMGYQTLLKWRTGSGLQTILSYHNLYDACGWYITKRKSPADDDETPNAKRMVPGLIRHPGWCDPD